MSGAPCVPFEGLQIGPNKDLLRSDLHLKKPYMLWEGMCGWLEMELCLGLPLNPLNSASLWIQ